MCRTWSRTLTSGWGGPACVARMGRGPRLHGVLGVTQRSSSEQTRTCQGVRRPWSLGRFRGSGRPGVWMEPGWKARSLPRSPGPRSSPPSTALSAAAPPAAKALPSWPGCWRGGGPLTQWPSEGWREVWAGWLSHHLTLTVTIHTGKEPPADPSQGPPGTSQSTPVGPRNPRVSGRASAPARVSPPGCSRETRPLPAPAQGEGGV